MILFLFLCFSALRAVELSPLLKDGYSVNCLKCHGVDDNKLNVHLVPHSHDDVGWLKTYDQYYYGLNNSIQQASVQSTITSMVDALWANPNRKYIQVETAFFWKWWKDQSEDMQSRFKTLVENGQIEMVNGAWVMNDEACTNYQSTIDQFTWGLRLINDTLGSCGIPRVGWQIDPFGHSREQASLFSQFGYDAFLLGRLDFADRAKRQNNSNFEFIWKGSTNLDNANIFGGILPSGYGAPEGFCFDIICADDPIDDDPDSLDYNVDYKVELFTKIVKGYQKFYKTNNVLITMGSDFEYVAAETNFINTDRLIKAFENHTELNVFYSTPSCYIKSVNDANATFSVKTDDFFPYSDDDHSYWGGYFTSRPNSKRFERTGHNILQVTKQLYGLSSYNSSHDESDKYLRHLRESMGTIQHHDAITGTEKEHVMKDYVRMLNRGIVNAEDKVGELIKKLLKLDDKNVTLNLSSCILANISICNVSQFSDKKLVFVYNPLAWTVSHFVRLPIESNDFYDLEGPDGQQNFDISPSISDFSFVKLTLKKPSRYNFVFEAKDLPPFGFKVYHVEKTGKFIDDSNNRKPLGDDYDEMTFGWESHNFTVNRTTNLLKSISMNGITLKVQQKFLYYNSTIRNIFPEYNDDSQTVSGAYMFRPNGTAIKMEGSVTNEYIFRGFNVHEFHQTWSDPRVNITQIIRVYKNQNYIEFDWLVGDIIRDDYDFIGKEVISRFSIADDFENNNTFYTDSNGREMIKRVLNQRPDYNSNNDAEPVASNYYPVTSKISVRDELKNLQVSILNDRSQGGSSLEKGEIELMVHRRLFFDDWRGVGEPLNETEFGTGVYVRGSHYLVFGKANGVNENGITTNAQERILAQKKLLQPWIGVSATDKSYDDLEVFHNTTYSGLSKALPDNVNILTFEPWKNDTFILRLEHIMEEKDDPKLSSVVTVNLKNLFNDFEIKEVEETTLGANVLLNDFRKQEKYSWQTKDGFVDVGKTVQELSDMEITLSPMQIRTFIVKLVT